MAAPDLCDPLLSDPAGATHAPEPVAANSGTSATSPHADPFAVTEALRYTTTVSLGSGGMGTVELAYDERLGREVALKSPHPRLHGAAERMAHEARITARLEHPGIVPIYDAGRRADGRAFYAMRLVRGRSLEHTAKDGGLAWLRHYLAACEAVAFAHARGIVHRDLKPDNILVGELGDTQVADWGLALDLREASRPQPGVGTPAYMSPEQRHGEPAALTDDVWSLGVVLYRLLTGTFPPTGDLGASPRELAAIVERALAPEPALRYPSARELAADVASFLDGRRVAAHSYSTFELLRRLVRAWRVPLAVGVVALVILIVGAIVAVERIIDERDRVVVAERAGRRSLAAALAAQAEQEFERGQLPEAEVLAAEALALGDGEPSAHSAQARGIVMANDRHRPAIAHTAPLPPCENRVIHAQSALAPYAVCAEPGRITAWAGEHLRWSTPIDAFALAVDGDTLWALARSRKLHRLRLSDGVELGPRDLLFLSATRLVAGEGRALVAVGWEVKVATTDGRVDVIRACAERRAVTALWVAATHPPTFVAGCDDGTFAYAHADTPWRTTPSYGGDVVGLVATLSRDGRTLATLNERGVLTLASFPDAHPLGRYETPHRGPRSLDFDTGATRLLLASEHGAVSVIEAATGREIYRLPRAFARHASWDDGMTLVAADSTRRVTWHLPEQSPSVQLGSGVGVASFSIGPQGKIAVGRGDGSVELYARDGRLVAATQIGTQTIKSVVFDGRGDLWVSMSGRAGLTPLIAADFRLSAGAAIGEETYRRVGVLADGAIIAAPYIRGPDVLAPDGALLTRLDALGPVRDLGITPDGRAAVLLDEYTGRVVWFEDHALRVLGTWPGAVAVTAAEHIAVLLPDIVRVIDRAGAVLTEISLTGSRATALTFASDHEHLAIGFIDGTIRVVTRAGTKVASLGGHRERIAQLATTDDALYSASWDGTVRRWGWSALTAPVDSLLDARTRWGLDMSSAIAP